MAILFGLFFWIFFNPSAGNIVSFLMLLVAYFSATVTYISHLCPSIRIQLSDPPANSINSRDLNSPFLLQCLTIVGGQARISITSIIDGTKISFKEREPQCHYSGKWLWEFSGQEKIVGAIDFNKLIWPDNSGHYGGLPKSMHIRTKVQLFTSRGIPVDEFSRYWYFNFNKWVWVLDVGGYQYHEAEHLKNKS